MKPVPITAKLDAQLALNQFRADPECLFKTGLGGVLTAACWLITVMDMQHLLLLPVALAISAVLNGYLLRTVRQRVKNPQATRMPEWGEWGDLFMSGITWIAIQFGINILAFTFISSTVLISYYAFVSPGANTLLIAESALLSILLAIFWVHFLSTFLWVNFAVEERLSGGLAFRQVTRLIRRNAGEIWIAWALSCALQLAAIILPSLTVLGIFLVPTTLFAAQLISAQLLAQAWKAVLED